jgi:hypothetical protein
MWQPALTETGWTRSWIAAAQSPQTGMSLDEGMAESNSLAWKYLKYIRRKKVVSCFFPFSVLWTSSSSDVDQLSSFRVACTDPISSRNKLKYSKANRLIRNPPLWFICNLSGEGERVAAASQEGKLLSWCSKVIWGWFPNHQTLSHSEVIAIHPSLKFIHSVRRRSVRLDSRSRNNCQSSYGSQMIVLFSVVHRVFFPRKDVKWFLRSMICNDNKNWDNKVMITMVIMAFNDNNVIILIFRGICKKNLCWSMLP